MDGFGCPGTAQSAELTDEPVPATEGGNAASEYKVILQQKRKWQPGPEPRLTRSIPQPPKQVQVSQGSTFYFFV